MDNWQEELEKDLKKIILSIDQFTKIFELFKTRFENIGGSIEKLEAIYADVSNKSFKHLDAKIKQIDEYKKGNKIALENAPEAVEISQGQPLESDTAV